MAEEVDLESSSESNAHDSVSVDTETISVSTHPVSRHKTQKDLEKEEILRKLQGLVSGDKLFIKKSTLGNNIRRQEMFTSNDFVECKLLCWIHDKMTMYLVIQITPYGKLRFKYGDLYKMALAHDLFFHKLDSRYIKVLKSDHVQGTKKSDHYKYQSETVDLEEIVPTTTNYKNDIENLKNKLANSDFKNRPMPPGVESFCKCKFTNKNEFVKKMRSVIKSNKHRFMEKTMNMKELRLIATQNVRAYELEILGYLMEENPWDYTNDPSEKPDQEKINQILEQYRNAVRNPIYIELYNKWQNYLKSQATKTNVQNTQ